MAEPLRIVAPVDGSGPAKVAGRPDGEIILVTEQVVSHWGGTRNGTVVHWPNGIKARGEIRSQFHHVIVPEDCQLTARHAEIPAWDGCETTPSLSRPSCT